MINLVIGRMIKKYGMLKVLMIVGDLAVKTTKTKKDDEIWEKIKKVIKKF
tara:strand:- start:94 stop:243 length:150 start_codon:yes stop_codon:yes gene_type:complete